jgi:ElaB/YqjD/DUF883 family membrane-anchored ribosome-binding protein
MKIKTLILAILLLLTGSSVFSQVYEPHYIDFGPAACQGNAPVLTATYLDVIRVACDTAWILNSTRYRLMLQAMDFVLKKDPNQGLKMIEQYEKSLKLCTDNYNELMTKHTIMADECSQNMHANIATIQEIRINLEKAQTRLKEANDQLAETQKTLEKQNKKNKRNTWLIGAGGLGLGLLVGALIIGG